MNTRQRRGLLTAGMLTTAVLGGGLFAARAQESGFSAMAELAPQDSTAFVALDLRGSLELPDAVARLRATSISLPELGQVIHSLEDTLGSSLEQVSQWASPSAFMAVCPTAEYQQRLHPSAADPQAGAAERAQAGLRLCASNLKNIATSCEMYSTDYAGHYPTSLGLLTPNYLKSIPTCGTAGVDTYSSGFVSSQNPDAYTISCHGKNHPELAADHPVFTSTQGFSYGNGFTLAHQADSEHEPLVQVVFGMPVRSEKLAQEFLTRFDAQPGGSFLAALGHASDKKLPALEIHMRGTSTALALYKGIFYVASSPTALQEAVDVADHKLPNLAADPQFLAARAKVSTNQGMLAYSPLGRVGQDLTKLYSEQLPPVATTRERLTQTLQGIRFGVVSVDLQAHSEGFLGLDPASKSPAVQAMLTSPGQVFSSGERVAASTGTYSAAQARYGLEVALGLASIVQDELGSDPREALEKALGINLERDLWTAFTGEVAYSVNLEEVVMSSFATGFGEAAAQGKLTACKSNEKNIGIALEMYATDANGLYPRHLSQVAPNYLKTIPTCPSAGRDTYSASYRVSNKADAFTFFCQGANHARAGLTPNHPRYTESAGLDLGPERAVAGAEEMKPSGLIVLRIKESGRARKLLRKVGIKGTRVARIKGSIVYKAEGFPAFYAQTAGSKPMLLIGFGPKGRAVINQALKLDPAESVANDPLMKTAVLDHNENWTGVHYQQLGPLVKAFFARLNGARVTSGLAPLPFGSAEMTLNTLSYTLVEPDGLRYRSAGSGGGTAMMGGGMAVAAAIFIPNFIRAREQGQLTACKSNLKNIGTSLEMYSTDNAGRYPTSMAQLTPNYLRDIPTCPAAGKDTYSGSFQSASNPDAYTFYCSGHNHGKLEPNNMPSYNSTQGLTT